MHYRKQIIVLVLYYYQLLNDTKKYINKIAMRVQLTLTWSKPIYQKNQRLMNPTYEVHMFPFIFLIRLFYAPYSHYPTSPDPSLFRTIVLRFLVCTISQCACVPTNFIHFLPLKSFLFKHKIQYQKHVKYCMQVLFFYAKLSIRKHLTTKLSKDRNLNTQDAATKQIHISKSKGGQKNFDQENTT